MAKRWLGVAGEHLVKIGQNDPNTAAAAEARARLDVVLAQRADWHALALTCATVVLALATVALVFATFAH